MDIRNLQQNDLENLIPLYKEFWDEDSDLLKMKETYKQIVKDPNHIILTAVEKGILIGTISGIVCRSLYGDCSPFLVIEDFIITEKYRGKGIGKKLLSAIEEAGKVKGCNQAILVTETNRKDAQRFYESCGFPAGKNVGYKKSLID